jgi:hypothetical protein
MSTPHTYLQAWCRTTLSLVVARTLAKHLGQASGRIDKAKKGNLPLRY